MSVGQRNLISNSSMDSARYSSSSVKQLEKEVVEADEVTDIDFSVIDNTDVENLEGNKVAQTRHRQGSSSDGYLYSSTDVVADPELLEGPREDLRHAIIHEAVHGNVMNGKTDQVLGSLDIEESDREKLRYNLEKGPEPIHEGTVELITHILDPNSRKVGKKFYPDEMEYVEQSLEDSELLAEMNAIEREIIDEYRDVYDVEIGEGFYMETGELAGQGYNALVLGEGAEAVGEDVVMSYLSEGDEYEGFEQEDLYSDEGYMANEYPEVEDGVVPTNNVDWQEGGCC